MSVLRRLILTALLLLQSAAAQASPRPAAAQSERCFDETGYCLRSAALTDFFDRHGGTLGLGFPVSRLFRLRGTTIQLFQRGGLQLGPDGQVLALDLLGDELLPLRGLHGSRLPEIDPELLARAPRADSAGPERSVEEFLRQEVPDALDGREVSFLRTYLAAGGPTVARALYGWPASRPRADPNNPDRIYQRFERTILQYDAARGQTTALLLGDYVKAILVGERLPSELEPRLVDGPLWHQYHPHARDGLQRPWQLPDSDLADAFRPDRRPAPQLLAPAGFPVEDGWPTLSEPGEMSAEPAAGGYLVGVERAGTPDRAASAAVSTLQPLADFVLVADVQLMEGSAAGYALHLRRQTDQAWLALLVDASRGLACFYRRTADETTLLWDWSPVPAWRREAAVNRVTLRAVGRRFSAWVNGAPLFDLEADAPARGTLWLAAVTWGEPAQVLFGDLRLAEPE